MIFQLFIAASKAVRGYVSFLIHMVAIYIDSQQSELHWIDSYCPYINKAVGLTIHAASAWWPFPFLTTDPSLQIG